MPTEITIEDQGRCACVRITGPLTLEVLRSFALDLRATPGFRPDTTEIVDLTDVTAFEVSDEDLRVFAEFAGRGRGVRIAVVAPDDLAFGMARMYELLQSRTTNNIRVFRNLADARAWVDGSEPEVVQAGSQ